MGYWQPWLVQVYWTNHITVLWKCLSTRTTFWGLDYIADRIFRALGQLGNEWDLFFKGVFCIGCSQMKYRCKTAWAINLASIIPNISASYCAKRPPLKSFPNDWTLHLSSVIVINLTRCHNQGRATNEKLLVILACLNHFHVNIWNRLCIYNCQGESKTKLRMRAWMLAVISNCSTQSK